VVYTANWGIICHLRPIKGTRNNHWLRSHPLHETKEIMFQWKYCTRHEFRIMMHFYYCRQHLIIFDHRRFETFEERHRNDIIQTTQQRTTSPKFQSLNWSHRIPLRYLRYSWMMLRGVSPKIHVLREDHHDLWWRTTDTGWVGWTCSSPPLDGHALKFEHVRKMCLKRMLN